MQIISIDVAAQIRHKQIAHTVKGKVRWAIGWLQHGEGPPRPVRFVSKDAALIDVADAVIRHKQVARAVKSQTYRVMQA